MLFRSHNSQFLGTVVTIVEEDNQRQDFLYEDNIRTWEHMKRLGIEVTAKESEGNHSWDCWDVQIRDVLRWWLDR